MKINIPLSSLSLNDLNEAMDNLINEKVIKECAYNMYKRAHPDQVGYLNRCERIINSYDLAIEVMKVRINEIENEVTDSYT